MEPLRRGRSVPPHDRQRLMFTEERLPMGSRSHAIHSGPDLLRRPRRVAGCAQRVSHLQAESHYSGSPTTLSLAGSCEPAFVRYHSGLLAVSKPMAISPSKSSSRSQTAFKESLGWSWT